MEELYYGVNHNYDNMMLKWLCKNYKDKNIADCLSLNIGGFLGTIELKRNPYRMGKLDNIEKAIRQDIKKMLLSAKKIYDYSIECEKESSYNLWEYDEKKDSLQINMEYYIYKYRVIVEYIMKILDEVVYMDIEKYKKEHRKKFVDNYEQVNKKMEYIRKLVIRNNEKDLDLAWFDEIRKVRNQLIHEGASCMICRNSNEPLFQVYNLEVDDLLDADEFLSNGNVISCKYFIAVTIAYLTYFIDTIFQLLKDISDGEEFEWDYCKLNYMVTGNEYQEYQEFFDKVCGVSRNIPIYQETLFKMVEQYLVLS